MSLQIRVLGSGAGGGFPQWNCHCSHCAAVRAVKPGYSPRTQSSIAVSPDGHQYVLINASPDIRAQCLSLPTGPVTPLRSGVFRGIVLMDAQIDHTAGLLLLRESPHPLDVYCTPEVCEELTERFPVFGMLQHYCGLNWHEIPIDGRAFEVEGVDGIAFRAVPLRSNAPPYSTRRDCPEAGDNIGLVIRDRRSGKRAFYAPGLGAIDATVLAEMRAAGCLLVDGTCWHDDDLARAGVGTKTSRAMGHLPQTGPGGMIETLSAFPNARRILIHINNTNPILDENGPERRQLFQTGIEVACDGMMIEL